MKKSQTRHRDRRRLKRTRREQQMRLADLWSWRRLNDRDGFLRQYEKGMEYLGLKFSQRREAAGEMIRWSQVSSPKVWL